MTIIQVVAVGILSAILALSIKKHSPEIALMITIVSSVLIFFMIMPTLAAAVGIINNFGNQLDSRIPYVALILQIIGIAYIAELGSQICGDAGESAIASKIELAGKVLIMAAASPVLIDVLNMIMGVMP